jgi:hypothetical protein
MATEVETHTGRCAIHGTVEGTRDMPKMTFPWIVNSIRRSMARRRPFLCPACGEPLDQG